MFSHAVSGHYPWPVCNLPYRPGTTGRGGDNWQARQEAEESPMSTKTVEVEKGKYLGRGTPGMIFYLPVGKDCSYYGCLGATK